MNIVEIKEKLYAICLQSIEMKINTIKERLAAITDSRDNETKSSVGDKYETGRAMMQMEEGNIKNQLSVAIKTQQELLNLSIDKKSDNVKPGSLVSTSNGRYYISVGLGEINVKDDIFYCISIQSPIGSLLRNKKKGDVIEFNGKQITIEDIN